MKKLPALLTLSLTFSLTSCSTNDDNFNNDKKLKIAATFAPIYDFTYRIVKDKVDLISITEDSEVHGYQINTPSKIAFVEKCDLLLAFGYEIDEFSKKLNPSKYFEVSKNLNLIESSDEKVRHDDHDHETDPHAWLSIKESIKILKNIYDKVVELDPANSDFYYSNYLAATTEFEELDREFQSKLEPTLLKTNKFVTSHNAFSYLARDYSLIQVGVKNINNYDPSPSEIVNLVSYIINNDIHTLVVSENDETDTLNMLKEEVIKKDSSFKDITFKRMSTYESVNTKDYHKQKDYVSVMKHNLETLESIFK